MATAKPDTILKADATAPFAIRSTAPLPTGEGVIDEATFRSIEIDRLFDAVDHCRTTVGKAVLYRSLVRPESRFDQVAARQEAMRELEGDTSLRHAVTHLLKRAASKEKDFSQLLYARFIGLLARPADESEADGYGYETYQNGTGFMLRLAHDIIHLPGLRSAYLKDIQASCARFADSRAAALMRGPVYRTESALVTKAEKRWYTPAFKFTPTLFKPVALSLGFVGLLLVVSLVPELLAMAEAILPAFWIFLLPIALCYAPVVGGMDRDNCIYPLRDIYRRSPEVAEALDALGKLDELMALHAYSEAFGSPCALPTLVDSPTHKLKVEGVRNPILGKGNPAYVPNDIDLSEERLTLITGPNSGGKTAFCKTLAQAQILAQAGGHVPAAAAEMSVADRVFYQTPEMSQLDDGEGRFGTELKRTKGIFLTTTPRSLVVLDELSEGTTSEEKLEISATILEGFHKKGNNTLLITHNHELVDVFQDQNIGLARQVEFVGEAPTHRLIPGISRVSHAHRIARKIGFAKEDIAKYLEEHGI